MEKGTNREFIERWKRVGPLLEEIRWQELRLYRHEDHWKTVEGLMEMAVAHGTPRTTSGLVEIQKLLHRKKK